MVVTRTTVWVDGNTLTASALNGEFNNLLNAPAIVNSDISASAGIVTSKITFGGTNGQFLKSNGSGGLTYAAVSVNRAFGFFTGGTQSIANDVSWNPTSPQALTANKLWVYARTQPVGSSLTVQIYNVTQAAVVASVSISSGTSSASTSSMTTASIAAGDILRMDITAVGSSTPGSDISAVLETTQ